MDRTHFYELMNGPGKFDYELYLNTPQLLGLQKDFDAFCNRDELMFQIVHQSDDDLAILRHLTLADQHRVAVQYPRVHH